MLALRRYKILFLQLVGHVSLYQKPLKEPQKHLISDIKQVISPIAFFYRMLLVVTTETEQFIYDQRNNYLQSFFSKFYDGFCKGQSTLHLSLILTEK